jgi:MFS family permease
MSQRNRNRLNLVYLEWSLISFAYVLAFLQRVSPQTISDYISRDFQLDGHQLGIVASAYFYGYTLMQFPAGVLVDQFGVRRILISSLLVSSIGSAIFALSPTMAFLCAGRVIVAFGDAVVFSCLIKFVVQRLPPARFGLMSGLSQISGYVGGILATTPLALAVEAVGWRNAFAGLALIVLLDLAASVLFLKQERVLKKAFSFADSWQSIKASVAKKAGWGCALAFGTYFVAATSFSGVWGIPMLMQAYGMSREQAGNSMLLFMLGTAIGSLAIGYISDIFTRLPLLLSLSCVLRAVLFVCIAPLFVGGHWSYAAKIALFGLGFLGGGTVPLLLRAMKGIYTAESIGTGSSLNATLAGLLAAAAQPALGLVLDSCAWSQTADGPRIYSAEAYTALTYCFAAISAAGLLGVAIMSKMQGTK